MRDKYPWWRPQRPGDAVGGGWRLWQVWDSRPINHASFSWQPQFPEDPQKWIKLRPELEQAFHECRVADGR